MHNTGLQDQPVLYVQDGVDGIPARAHRSECDGRAGRPVPGGPVALTAMEVNAAGTAVAYGLSTSGSDRQEIFVRDVESGADRADRLQWAKFVAIALGERRQRVLLHEVPGARHGAARRRALLQQGLLPSPRRPAGARRAHLREARRARNGLRRRDQRRRPVGRDHRLPGVERQERDLPAGSSIAPAAAPAPLFTGFASAYAFIEAAAFNSRTADASLLQNRRPRAPRQDCLGRSLEARRGAGGSRCGIARQAVGGAPHPRHARRVVPAERQRPHPALRSRRPPGRHGRSAGDRLGLRHQRTAGRRRDVRRLQLLRLSAGQLSLRLRGEGARAVRPRTSARSIPRTTRRHRCGIPRRTARTCRCSWCAARGCRWTASGRCC